MTLGVGWYTWPWAVARGELSAADIAARAADEGFGVAPLCDNLGLEAIAKDLDRLRASGVTVELGGRGLATLPPWLDLAEAAHAPLVHLVIDTADHHPTPQEAVDALEATGTPLAIENHDRIPAATLAAMVDALGSDAVGVCLDTANSIGAGEGLETVLTHLAPRTLCLHLKDIAPTIFAPVTEVHRPTLPQMAALVETLAQTCKEVIREGPDAVVARGVPAAHDFLLGHLRIQSAILFEETPGRFSNAADKISARARPVVFRDDWERIFTDEDVAEQVRVIVAQEPAA